MASPGATPVGPSPAGPVGPSPAGPVGSSPAGPAGSGGRPPRSRRSDLLFLRRPLELAIRALLVANILVIALLLVVVLTSLPKTPGHPDQATPSESINLMSMGLAHIPTSASCLLCHETGGEAGLKPIPAIGHPLEGWRRCATCHTNATLGRTAPGHEGIPEEECLNCHKLPPEGPAITQPHSRLQDQNCLDCHGSFAHLPTSMVQKDETECWLCHKPTDLPPPEYPHVRDAALGCRECHTSPQVGGLPIDHALKQNSTCLLCHDIKQAIPTP
ncbi:MAG TPA: hypothetical protein VLS28_10970 [Candidatus Sulfomarinibacteraceae bacterium]|nr:hypothetical protein [Candidatus Sulfomarinibacteraceae bacterium]